MSDVSPLDIDFEFGQDLAVVGKYHVEHRANSIVTGKYKFTNDHHMPKLYGRTLGSPHAHANILSIDTSKAEALEGVKAVITYQDLPGSWSTGGWTDTILCWGQEIAAVAAVDEATAERALELIEVEYEVLPFNLTAEDALESGAPLTGTFPDSNVGSPRTWTRGDVEAGLAEADVIVEETVGWGRPHTQNTIEPCSAIAWWDGEDVYGYDCNQAPHSYGRGNAGVLGISYNKYHVKVLGAGGGFGGGGQTQEPTTAALLSKKAGMPVQMTRQRRLQTPSRRNHYGPRLTMRIGCKNDGTMTALETIWYTWGGKNGGRGGYNENLDTTFMCDNIHYESYGVATNTGFCSGYRCLAHPETGFLMDVVLDKMADKLGMTPLEFLRKIIQTPDRTEVQLDNGNPLGSPSSLQECLETAAAEIGFEGKWHPNGQNNVLPDGRLHGIGIHAHLDRHGTTGGGRGAIINARSDGTFLLTTGMSAHSGGPQSQVAIVAEALGVPYEAVQVGSWGDSDVSPDGGGQFGSTSCTNNGAAAYMAAMDIREQLFAEAASMLEVNPEDLDAREGKVFVKTDPTISITHAEVMDELGNTVVGVGTSWRSILRKPMAGFPVGNSAWHRTGVAGAFEVAIDPETGEVEVLNYVNVCDAGRVIDRHACEGQIMSGYWVQAGMKGRLWDVKHDPVTGVLLSQTFLDDKMPTSMDLDETKENSIFLETISAIGPFGCNGIGEPAASANYPAYFNAVGNALGVRIAERPIPPQKILEILGKA